MNGIWYANTTNMQQSKQTSSCGANFLNNQDEYTIEPFQYIDLKPVALPEGVVAVGASFVEWTCSGLPQASFYNNYVYRKTF